MTASTKEKDIFVEEKESDTEEFVQGDWEEGRRVVELAHLAEQLSRCRKNLKGQSSSPSPQCAILRILYICKVSSSYSMLYRNTGQKSFFSFSDLTRADNSKLE